MKFEKAEETNRVPYFVQLEATGAIAARNECRQHFPQGCSLKGYDEDGECVYITVVRPHGDKYYVATATMNRGKRPVRFIAKIGQ